MLFLLGLDDTDNAASENTGSLALRLGCRIEERCAVRLVSVTQHQLLQNAGISCTTNNCCYCVLLDASHDAQRDIELICRSFLLRECAAGSNAGFALVSWSTITPSIGSWGEQARSTLLGRLDAMSVARESKVAIAGFTGSGLGVIGALAAVGLYYEGNSGGYYWLPGLKNLKGIYTYTSLIKVCPIERVENSRGRRPLSGDRINIGNEAYPILRDGKSLLLLEPARKGEAFEWAAISQEKANQLSK